MYPPGVATKVLRVRVYARVDQCSLPRVRPDAATNRTRNLEQKHPAWMREPMIEAVMPWNEPNNRSH